jgi:GST-like protein
MMGERGHFSRVAENEGDQSYARRIFNDEVHRLYGVLNNRLHHPAVTHVGIAQRGPYLWSDDAGSGGT